MDSRGFHPSLALPPRIILLLPLAVCARIAGLLRGGLAPLQERRVKELMSATLNLLRNQAVSVFTAMIGVSPGAWRRVNT